MPVTQEFIESLMKQNQMLVEQVDSLNKTIAELNATIKELREQRISPHTERDVQKQGESCKVRG